MKSIAVALVVFALFQCGFSFVITVPDELLTNTTLEINITSSNKTIQSTVLVNGKSIFSKNFTAPITSKDSLIIPANSTNAKSNATAPATATPAVKPDAKPANNTATPPATVAKTDSKANNGAAAKPNAKADPNAKTDPKSKPNSKAKSAAASPAKPAAKK